MRDFDGMTWLGIGVIVAILALVCGAIYDEYKHPCLVRGPEKLQYMNKVGDTYFPVYYGDCLVRAGDSPRQAEK